MFAYVIILASGLNSQADIGADTHFKGVCSLFLNRSLPEIIGTAFVLLIAMDIHEFAHNYVGYQMGDPTPRDMGRLTLNPLVHINWVGWLMWVVVGFGILGSAPISEYRMRDRRWGYLAAVAAGPFSNLGLAAVAAIPFRLGLIHWTDAILLYVPRQVFPTLPQFMLLMVEFNILLFLFNLLPFFPFDGWHILRKLLPPDLAYELEKYQQISLYIFFGLLLLSFTGILNIFSVIIGPPEAFLLKLLIGF